MCHYLISRYVECAFVFLALMCLLTEQYFICDFKYNNSCGYKSQENLLSFQIIESMETLSSSGMMVLDLTKINQTIGNGARLYGKYYPTLLMSDVRK